MTQQERGEYRSKMRTANYRAAEQIRMEHFERMKERARQLRTDASQWRRWHGTWRRPQTADQRQRLLRQLLTEIMSAFSDIVWHGELIYNL